MNLRSWLRRVAETPRAAPVQVADAHPGDAGTNPVFVCATCGRTDLPEAGDWDPPICEDCDAAINEDSLYEDNAFDDQ